MSHRPIGQSATSLLAAILIAGLAHSADAQDPNGREVVAPSGYIPAQTICTRGADGKAACPPSIPTADPNNAPIMGATTMTIGSTYPAARSIGANCTDSGGAVIQMADGSTVQATLGIGWQSMPFSATSIVSSDAPCTFYELH